MVRYCYICKLNPKDSGNEEISLHSLPNNIEIRNVWFSLLGLEKDRTYPKIVYICSNHFNREDIIFNKAGKRILKPNALPTPVHHTFEREETETTSTSPVKSISSLSVSDLSEDSPPKKKPKAEFVMGLDDPPTFFDIVASSSTATASEGTHRTSLSFQNVTSSSTCTASEVANRSSSTLTAPETEELCRKEATAEMDQTKKTIKPRISAIKRKRKTYVGDMDEKDFSSPKTRQKFLTMKKTVFSLRKKVHTLQSKLWKSKKKIDNLKDLLKYFREQSLITESSEGVLKASLSGVNKEMFERMLKGPTTQKYTPALRSFALTLAFYSPRAYNFVRSTFNRSLPHLSTITKWYKSVDGSPGFSQEALNALKIIQAEAEKQSKFVICNLVFDEMSIRRQVEWTGKKMCGYVDIAANIDSDILPEAKEVLVFMLVCVNASWKIPVGYFFLAGLSAFEKAELVKKCLLFLSESDIIVASLTFDGAPVNFNMAVELGANFDDPRNLKTHFSHPVTGDDVFIFLDPSHMIKLVRNTFGSQKYLLDSRNDPIDWSFLIRLVEIQSQKGLHLGNKLKFRHLEWTREKMKVKIATQTLSKSVADALLYLCEDLNLSEFNNVHATAKFIQNFNDLFDLFNSRNRLAKYFFKKPLSPATSAQFFNFLDYMSEYIMGIKLENAPVVFSSRKTGFLGFLICMKSLKQFFHTCIIHKKVMKYILTNKLSQDHLELFFGAIRAKGGYNNNPSARQFESAFKRLLVHAEIRGPDTGNVANLNKIQILTCGSGQTLTFNDDNESVSNSADYLKFEENITHQMANYNFSSSDVWCSTPYYEDVVGYIAGFVVKKLKKCVTCTKCKTVLECEHIVSQLQVRKQYGNLIKASPTVISLCKIAEKCFRHFDTTVGIFNKKICNPESLLVQNAMNNLSSDILSAFQDHLYEDDPVDGHVFHLIKLLLSNYFQLRIHHETVKKLDSAKKGRLRSMLTKTILFRNE